MTDGWRPALDKGGLQDRAQFFATTREFFHRRDVMEVDTPVLSRCASCDPNIHSLVSNVGGDPYYLHTSPEFFMKRLLAAGSGDIYSIARVFRNDEIGRLHNPEFVLLEWYRIGFDVEAMVDETLELINELLGLPTGSTPEPRSYSDVFREYAGVDPLAVRSEDLEQIAAEAGLDSYAMNRDSLLDLIAGLKVIPELGKNGLEVVTGYPASQAALAEINASNPAIADRFEVFLHGIELANGFRELRDATVQKARFGANNAERRQAGKPEMLADDFLLEALEHGLPACSGVAVGLDRVFMLASGASTIAEAMSFPISKC